MNKKAAYVVFLRIVSKTTLKLTNWGDTKFIYWKHFGLGLFIGYKFK